MAQIREGSIVNLVHKEGTGVGSNDVSYNSATVDDITRDGITFDTGSSVIMLPWDSVRRITLVTH